MQSNQKILLVDDEPRNLRILEEILSELAELRSASTGEEALVVAAEFLPDLILLDIMMPGIDGYKTCMELRKNKDLEHTRVIMVSGKAMLEERLKGYEAGADDYMTKPFSPDELEAKSKVYLKLVETEKKLQTLNENLEEQVRVRTEQLLRTEKAAFIGMHVAELVHNLNNPLMILMLNLMSLEKKYPEEEHIKKANKGAEKLRQLIKTIMQSGKQESDNKAKLINVNEILESELKVFELKRFFKEQIQVHLDLQPVQELMAQPLHFSQIFTNLLKNAIDAIYFSEKKELNVKSRQEGNNVVIEIRDSGCGIPKENLDMVFESFFTTKNISGGTDEPMGTGLGLPSVKRMLEAYGGKIEIESVEGLGTNIKLIIPLSKVEQKEKSNLSKKEARARIYPIDETERLKALRDLNILDTEAEQIFDDLTFLASTICQVPIAAISLVDSDRQWFKAGVGLSVRETPREISFCTHAIQGRTPLVVENALEDDRFVDNPLVTNDPNIRFYAGAPLISSDGYAVGTLCVIDQVPRMLNARQLTCLQAVARQVIVNMEWKKTLHQLLERERLNVSEALSLVVDKEIGRPVTDSLKNLSLIKGQLIDGLRDIRSFTENVVECEAAMKRIEGMVGQLTTELTKAA